MTMTETLALAHDVAGGRAAAAPARPAPDPVILTRREQQVAVLVASGRTNRQIGRTLGIAEKTVEIHLKNVMAKLGALQPSRGGRCDGHPRPAAPGDALTPKG